MRKVILQILVYGNTQKKYHYNNPNKLHQNTQILAQNVSILHQNAPEIVQNKWKFNCKFCNNNFTRNSSLKKHYNRCKVKNKNNLSCNSLEEIKEELKETITNDVINNILKNAKIHPKTLQKINKQLNHIGDNNTVINNNNTVINNTFVKFGPVDFEKLLNEEQKLSILNKPFMSLEESIKLIHFNDKIPEYNNIYITNMRDNLAYIYDGFDFKVVDKNNIISDLIDNHLEEIELLFDTNKTKLSNFKIERLQSF